MKSIRYTMYVLLVVAMVFSTALADGTAVNPLYKYAHQAKVMKVR